MGETFQATSLQLTVDFSCGVNTPSALGGEGAGGCLYNKVLNPYNGTISTILTAPPFSLSIYSNLP